MPRAALSSEQQRTLTDDRSQIKQPGAVVSRADDWLWEQEAASLNLAIPTSSEYMPILVEIVHGAEAGASVRQF